ncbi:hypothetical protein F53441_5083 [Fusarium austroafricanum]|uniref:Uncharacterized protein n=1 Tax=Fusarium austroafricanum TaxID=2364996 RepID=A0A8H4NY30_9HYPO|nr:hypothetical protein F53441_5083 [Fusarium austroafricanum]
MMHPLFGAQPAGSLPFTYSHDAFLGDRTQQIACSQASMRLSRGSSGQRPGGAMRVVKPTSASNSPRSSGFMARRKTLMNDGNSQRRQQQIMEQLSTFCDLEQHQTTQRSSRPVSWHPSSYGQQPQAQLQQPSYALATSHLPVDHSQDTYGNHAHYSPMISSTSCGTSPLAFSHLPVPYQSADNMTYNPYQGTGMSQHSPVASMGMDGRQLPATSAPVDATYSNGLDWNTFIMHGFGSTTPPTPETLPQTQLSQPAVSEDPDYQALEDATEEDGEILVGMGLYDTPEKYNEDPQLDNYRSTVSSLLGSSFRSHEPRGKGLKLEETWEPPKSDEEDEGEDEEDDEEEENEQ